MNTRKKKESAEALEFPIGNEDYKRFENLVSAKHLTLDEALHLVLVKGMEAYWPQQFADMVTDYARLEKRIEEYKRDNGILNRIYSQNFELKTLLGQTREDREGL